MGFVPNQRYQINEIEVAAKVIEGEAVMINLTTGTYYSMEGTGAYVWELLEKYHNIVEIAHELSRRYQVSSDEAAADLSQLVDELFNENLILASDSDPVAPLSEVTGSERDAYTSPELNTYRDMSDMLALDPPMPGLNQIPWEGNQEK
jgi:hypothetical protein